ncbi:MAG: hypothetical protein IJH20_04700 [Bacilli bacterium]|nr:hypothetical protein [Bacilli bacterium]
MKLFENVKNYIGENKFRLIIYSDKVNIVNYDSIEEIGATKIIFNADKQITIEGKNLIFNKLLNKEILVTGDIEKIYFNE